MQGGVGGSAAPGSQGHSSRGCSHPGSEGPVSHHIFVYPYIDLINTLAGLPCREELRASQHLAAKDSATEDAAIQAQRRRIEEREDADRAAVAEARRQLERDVRASQQAFMAQHAQQRWALHLTPCTLDPEHPCQAPSGQAWVLAVT